MPGKERPGQPKDKPAKLSLFVQKVDVFRITSILENEGTFQAQIFVRCVFKGGALDPNLSAVPEGGTLQTPYFPFGSDGKPTFKPNAA